MTTVKTMKQRVTGVATFIGVDLHKCLVTLRAVRADGELPGELTCTTTCVEHIAEWITNLPGPRAHRWFLAFGGLLQPAQRLAFGNDLDQIVLIERQREILRRQMLTAFRSPQFTANEQLLRVSHVESVTAKR